jgi:hypothetical protein
MLNISRKNQDVVAQSMLVCRDATTASGQTCFPYISQHSVRHESVSKSFRTGRLERELQMVQLSTTRCSCIAIL